MVSGTEDADHHEDGEGGYQKHPGLVLRIRAGFALLRHRRALPVSYSSPGRAAAGLTLNRAPAPGHGHPRAGARNIQCNPRATDRRGARPRVRLAGSAAGRGDRFARGGKSTSKILGSNRFRVPGEQPGRAAILGAARRAGPCTCARRWNDRVSIGNSALSLCNLLRQRFRVSRLFSAGSRCRPRMASNRQCCRPPSARRVDNGSRVRALGAKRCGAGV